MWFACTTKSKLAEPATSIIAASDARKRTIAPKPKAPADGVVAAPTEASAVVLGGANMDLIADTSGAIQAGDSTPGAIACSPGGVGRNVAENLARLGVPTALITVVSDDAFGRAVLDDAARCGIHTSGCLVVAGGRSPTELGSAHRAGRAGAGGQ